MLRSSRSVIATFANSQNLLGGFIGRRWCTAEHTLAVKKKIEETRARALKAGGDKRIASQHQRVCLLTSAWHTCCSKWPCDLIWNATSHVCYSSAEREVCDRCYVNYHICIDISIFKNFTWLSSVAGLDLLPVQSSGISLGRSESGVYRVMCGGETKFLFVNSRHTWHCAKTADLGVKNPTLLYRTSICFM